MSAGQTVGNLVFFFWIIVDRGQKNILTLVNKYVFPLWCEVVAVIFFLYYLCSLRENSHVAALSLLRFGQPAISDLNTTAPFLTREFQALLFKLEVFQSHSCIGCTSLQIVKLFWFLTLHLLIIYYAACWNVLCPTLGAACGQCQWWYPCPLVLVSG